MKHTDSLRALAPVVAVALILTGGSSALADVRLQDSGPDEPALAIRLSPAGPWSLVGPLDATVLNPAGDSYADGLPDDAPQGDELLAAWVRPGDGRVHLSHWDESTWTPLEPFEESASIGVPRVHALGEGWSVTWQRLLEEPLIHGSGVGATGEHHDSEPLIHGWLLDVSWMDDIQLILHQNPERTALILTGVLWSVPGVPSPVDIVFSTELGPMNPWGGDGLPSPSIAPVMHPSGKDFKKLRGNWSRRIAVSWWDSEGDLQQATIDKHGDVRKMNKPRTGSDQGLTGTLIETP